MPHHSPNPKAFLALGFFGLSSFIGCNQESKSPKTEIRAVTDSRQVAISSNTFKVTNSVSQLNRNDFESADLRILFVGNSHTRTSPALLGNLLRKNRPNQEILIARSMGGFLADHLANQNTVGMLEFGRWDFVILQAQKYSTSGKYTYPIDAAIELANRAKSKGATVIMFPEWSRSDFPEEFVRINRIHQKIADETSAMVAPIGESWRAVLKQFPGLELYHADGNHASKNGHFVNACIFYQLIARAKGEKSLANADFFSEIEKQIAGIVHELVPSSKE